MNPSTERKPLPAWARLPIALLFLIPVFVAQILVWRLRSTIGIVATSTLSAAIASLLGWAVYRLYVLRFERRPVTEFGTPGALLELSSGLAIGALIFAATMGVLALMGAYRIAGTGNASLLVVPLAMSIGSGVIEEILFRGVIFRLLEASLGTWIALTVSALLFGLGHLLGSRATAQGAIAIIFEAGIMLAAAYLLTRRLWLPIGIHVGWNFTEGGIFGTSVSGSKTKGLFEGVLTGPDWLSGGSFGPEASIVAVVLCVALGVSLLIAAARRRRFVSSPWRRDSRSSQPDKAR